MLYNIILEDSKMLIEFKVGNFRSFKDIVTLSMVASSDKEHIDTNTFPVNGKLKLIKSAVIYGANASGKTNLFKAMDFMKHFILQTSKKSQSTDKIPTENYRLNVETDGIPSSFEITFMIDDIRYRYGFQVDQEQVHAEWLFFVPSIREATLFTREKNKIRIGDHFKEGKGLEQKTRDNALFLSVVDQFNGETARKILKWLQEFQIILGLSGEDHETLSAYKLDDPDYKNFTTKLLRSVDFGIKGIKKEYDLKYNRIELYAIHQKYDRNNKPVEEELFTFSLQESDGTQALFAFSAPIYYTLKYGGILAIDELTSKLHPLLTRALIEIFHNYNFCREDDSTPGAQLIFASHDTNILTNQFFRRDQIWFTQKDEYGATDLYSLEEYNVRKDASFNKDYIMGKYGAIPFIGDIESLFK